MIGAGGLGSPVALYLGTAGVGRITVIDPDHVDLTNLQRQIAHNLSRLGLPKAESVRAAVAAINPDVQLRAMVCRAESKGSSSSRGNSLRSVDSSSAPLRATCSSYVRGRSSTASRFAMASGDCRPPAGRASGNQRHRVATAVAAPAAAPLRPRAPRA